MSKHQGPESYLPAAVKTPLFAGLTEPEAAELLARDGIAVSRYEKGETIYAPDAFLKSIGFLTAGRASVTKPGGSGEMLMSILHPGELFGAATLFAEQGAYVARITALAATWAVLIQEDVFRDMMRTDFRVAENYMAYLTGRIRFLSGRIDGFAQDGAEDRLLLYLRRNAAEGVYRPEQGMRALSDALCMGRTTLYRALDALTQTGMIRRDGKTITLFKEER